MERKARSGPRARSRDGASATLAPVGRTLGCVGSMLLCAGCGCFFGTASEVTVTPAAACLQARAEGGCSTVELTVLNGCGEDLVFTGKKGTVTVAAGASLRLSPWDYGEVTEDEGACRGEADVPARLGQTEIHITFSFELVNRGAFKC